MFEEFQFLLKTRNPPTSKTKVFVVIVDCWKLLTIFAKSSIFDAVKFFSPLLLFACIHKQSAWCVTMKKSVSKNLFAIVKYLPKVKS